MSQLKTKSLSCLQIGVSVGLTVRQGRIPCFSALSTLALFDYVQSDMSHSMKHLPCLSPKSEQDETSGKENTRSDLQEALRRAYAEREKEREIADRNGDRQ